MGKIPTISRNTKLKVLKNLNIFSNDGSLRKEAHPVWKEAEAKLKPLQKKSIYLDVFQNRNEIKDDLFKHFSKKNTCQIKTSASKKSTFTSTDKSKDNKEVYGSRVCSLDDKNENEMVKLNAFINLHQTLKASESDVSRDANLTDLNELNNKSTDEFILQTIVKNPNPQNFLPLDFIITLDDSEWRLIKPVNGQLPKFEWTSVIAANIYDNTEIRCAYIFKVGKVYRTMPDKYIDFHAYCKQGDCQTYMYGVCKKKPAKDEDGIQFEISTYDTTVLLHHSKRPFMSTRRRKAGEKLVYMRAKHFKDEMVNNMMSFSDKEERPDIPTAANLRTVKVEGLRNYLGISGPTDPIKCLIYMMDEFHFIKEVYPKSFRASYWFDNQITLWNELAPLNLVVKLDATGSLVKKVTINEESSAYVYLYQLMTTVDGCYAPLLQMISSRHDANVINQWLNEWKSRVAFLPSGCVCDDGLALLYALCETLNDCTYKYYLSASLLILQGETDIPPLKCHMGLDRAHVIKTTTTWKAVKEKNDKTFTDFITRSVALASICETLQGVREVLLGTFIICESKTIEDKSICDEKYEWFMNKFETFGIGPKEEAQDEETKEKVSKKKEDEMKHEDIPIELCNSDAQIQLHMDSNIVKDYVKSIHDEALGLIKINETEVTDQNKNDFYCPEVINNLFFLYSQFPAWTNVMRAYFGSSDKVATSADVEAYFKDLRNTYNLKSILAAHTFVMYHGRIIDAQIKLARCKLMEILNQEDKSTIEQEVSKLKSEISLLVYDIEQVTSNNMCEANMPKEGMKKIISVNVNNAQAYSEVQEASANKKFEEFAEQKISTKVRSADADNQVNKVALKKDLKDKRNIFNLNRSTNEGKFHAYLRNGHLDEPVIINNREVIFGNTCAYDSAISILIFAYENNPLFKDFLDDKIKDNGLFFESIAGYSNRTMNMRQFYENRGRLLLHFQKDKALSYYNCESSVNTLLSVLLRNQFSCGEIVQCTVCNHRRLDKFRILIVNDVQAANLIRGDRDNIIHECIMDLFNGEALNCRGCRREERTAFGIPSLGFFLAIDISKVFEDHNVSTTHVPVQLLIQEVKLILAGFVVRKPAVRGGIAHYIAYCYDKDTGVYEVIDDTKLESSFIKTLPDYLQICTMIYVISEN